MSATTQNSRSRQLSKLHALGSARNMTRSSLGIAILRNISSENGVHNQAIRLLESEHRWRQRELRNKSKTFLTDRSKRPGPIIVFDRPPLTRDFTQRVFLFQNNNGITIGSSSSGSAGSGDNVPNYMRPTVASSNHTMPTIMPTIDAFQTVPKPRSNVIDKFYCPVIKRRPITAATAVAAATHTNSSLEEVRFRLAVQPSWPLTETEQIELQTGWKQYWRQMRCSRQSPSPTLTRSASVSAKRSN